MDAVTLQSEWDEALARLLVFLSACEIGGAEHRVRVAMRILGEARASHARDPARTPVEVTMDLAVRSLEDWFAGALNGTSTPSARRVAAGLFAWKVTDAAAHWPDVMLAGEPPADLKAALSLVSNSAHPDLAISSMTPREMDYGTMERIAQRTWHQFAWAPLLSAASLWTAIFFLALYAYDRFFPQ